MFDDLDNLDGHLSEDAAFGLMRELEQNRSEEIRKQRAHFRIAIKARITMQSGNASELLNYKVQGTTGDISERGLGAIFPIAPRVGDIYRLAFNPEDITLPLTFARCVRCRLVQEGAYDSGFVFFSAIALPENVAANSAVL
ncbi:MAG: PilZ domain-containing protein [Phycisphaerae bacterium]|nr:PilZ domain-containing protein [Phycisphaerae bacterium]